MDLEFTIEKAKQKQELRYKKYICQLHAKYGLAVSGCFFLSAMLFIVFLAYMDQIVWEDIVMGAFLIFCSIFIARKSIQDLRFARSITEKGEPMKSDT